MLVNNAHQNNGVACMRIAPIDRYQHEQAIILDCDQEQSRAFRQFRYKQVDSLFYLAVRSDSIHLAFFAFFFTLFLSLAMKAFTSSILLL